MPTDETGSLPQVDDQRLLPLGEVDRAGLHGHDFRIASRVAMHELADELWPVAAIDRALPSAGILLDQFKPGIDASSAAGSRVGHCAVHHRTRRSIHIPERLDPARRGGITVF